MNESTPARHEDLPPFPTDRMDLVEQKMLEAIRSDRTKTRTRRRRVWTSVSAAAAVVVVAAVISPAVVGDLRGTNTGSVTVTNESLSDSSAAMDVPMTTSGEAGLNTVEGATAEGGDRSETGADIIASGALTLTVDDLDGAAASVTSVISDAGGYIENESRTSGGDMSGLMYDTSMPAPGTTDGVWMNVRVPADDLTAVMSDLRALGTVTSSSLSQDDVTDQTVDLRARIDAAEASVTRLTELMAQADSTSDLLAAETALSERQATLESYQQQLDWLESQVSMSSISINLSAAEADATPEPVGFVDGLGAGWSGLIVTLNAILISLGFLLPWIAVISVASLVIWLIVRLVKRARTRIAQAPVVFQETATTGASTSEKVDDAPEK
ncbi:hypothetical protein FHX49_000203 [Microbacterium endophyticum]|uniref:DUF4349 domain-containing protein n=1 Tax=Microbacterium endophyticum TaxID=1526412 RepID=A0A7W4YM28_9MICO|nr:DUF4349 domain-containing protein [Microbacterium endophyticum]MBB2974662.1 hypothetical protein [Microbacterium endophyticum]NIK36959.1 hypothetical protein [Microbacterium endophyticum]